MSNISIRLLRLTRGSRVGAWLLVFAPAFYLPAIFVNVALIGPILAAQGLGVIPFTELTRGQIDSIAGAWILFQFALVVSSLGGLVGVLLMARGLRRLSESRWMLVAWVAAIGALAMLLAFVILDALSLGFTTPTLGADPFYAVANVLGYAIFDLSLIAIGATAFGLVEMRLRRTLGWVVGVLATALLIAAVIVPLYVPPFAMALLACPVGIGVVTNRVRRDSARQTEVTATARA